eukprot:3211310-Pyramimonas_sp.AAC.1
MFAARRLPQHADAGDRPLPTRALQHHDFPRRLILEYGESLQQHPDSNPMDKLRLFKEAMRK